MAPRVRLAVAHNRPSWASTIDRQIDSPIPMPCALVVNNGENIRSAALGSTPFPVSSTDTTFRVANRWSGLDGLPLIVSYAPRRYPRPYPTTQAATAQAAIKSQVSPLGAGL